MAENDAKPSAPASAPPPKRGKNIPRSTGRGARTGLLAGGLALILASITLVAAGYVWYLLFYEKQELMTVDLAGGLDEVRRETQTLRQDLAALEPEVRTLKENQDTIRAALNKMAGDFTRRRAEWALAEAEQLLVIANNRLQLARDVRSALNALRAADALLKELADPKLLPVRRLLAREMNELAALEKADIVGVTLRLGALAESVDRLPLAVEVRTRGNAAPAPGAAAETSRWRDGARNIWQDVLSLVRIRTDVEVQRPLLPPEQQYFARENLRLMLYGAQFALLQGDAAVYRQNLNAANRMLKDFFDLNTQVVSDMQAELDRLKAERVFAELPDISTSLETLRRLLEARGGP